MFHNTAVLTNCDNRTKKVIRRVQKCHNGLYPHQKEFESQIVSWSLKLAYLFEIDRSVQEPKRSSPSCFTGQWDFAWVGYSSLTLKGFEMLDTLTRSLNLDGDR